MSRTRIVILQLKEIIYTAIFVGFGILLLILLFFMFLPNKDSKKNDSATTTSQTTAQEATSDSEINDKTTDKANDNSNKQTSAATYKAGVYTSELTLGDSKISLQVDLDQDHVKSVELVNLEESVETMYPLIKPAVKEISDQLAQNVSPEEVVLSEDSPYTSQLILEKVSQILDDAAVK